MCSFKTFITLEFQISEDSFLMEKCVYYIRISGFYSPFTEMNGKTSIDLSNRAFISVSLLAAEHVSKQGLLQVPYLTKTMKHQSKINTIFRTCR